MKPFAKTLVITTIISVILFIVGYNNWSTFFNQTVPKIGNVKYLQTTLGIEFRNSLLFGFVVALIPMATAFVWIFTPVVTPQKKLITIFIIFLTSIAFVLCRREMIKYHARQIERSAIPGNSSSDRRYQTIDNTFIPISTLNFEWFALAGVVTGSAISILLLRQRFK